MVEVFNKSASTFNEYKISDDEYEDMLNCQADLEECWHALALKYFDSKVADTKVFFREGFIKSSKGAMLGSTRLKNDGTIYVLVSSMTDELDDKAFYNVLLHEMCHCASYYDAGDLDASHTREWKTYADKLNKLGWHLTPACDVDLFS